MVTHFSPFWGKFFINNQATFVTVDRILDPPLGFHRRLQNNNSLYLTLQGSIKEEVQIDQIYHRLEKNQLQLNQRLNDVDSNLETIRKIQVGRMLD